jgi:hypothetical protein
MTIAEGERECAGSGLSEIQISLFDISMPPLIPRQLLCKKCLNILLDNERKKKGKI